MRRLLPIALVAACSGSSPPGPAPRALPVLPPPEPCTQTATDDPRAFPPCGDGAGVFGRWQVDEFGLPAYEYMAAQELDDRALIRTRCTTIGGSIGRRSATTA